MENSVSQPKRSYKRVIIGVTILFIVVVLGLVVGIEYKSSMDQQALLAENIKAQLISISIAAREYINVDEFISLNSEADRLANMENYYWTLVRLRLLAKDVGAKYIYALKLIDGEYQFIYDTDVEDPTVFTPYNLSPVHEAAIAGEDSAGVMNVQDDYGTFNTSAVPIWKDGVVVGIVCTDIEDTYLQQSRKTVTTNIIILLVTLVLAMGLLLFMVIFLFNRVEKMQRRLTQLAHYDAVTGLPNRQYLLEFLSGITKADSAPFALLFIDLDNFKSVNDNAGHEAGDELLRSIAQYLDSANANSMAFRPSAGRLNLSARIGGDEFVQVVSGISTEEEAAAVGKRLLDGFAERVDDRFVKKYAVGLSIGVALFPYHSSNFHVLIKYADIAMYHAKRAGKNQYRVYADEMGKDDPDNMR